MLGLDHIFHTALTH